MTNYKHRKRSVSDAYRVFFDALKYHSPVQIIQKAYEFFGMPVLLTDSRYQLIAICPEEPIGVDIYDTLLKKRILPSEVIEEYQKMYLSGNPVCYEPFYSDTGLVENCPRIFGEVYSGSRIYGHFAVMMFDQPLFPSDLECAGILKQALDYAMVPRNRSESDSSAGYLKHLLDRSANAELKLFASDALEKTVVKNYALMVTPIGQSAGQHAFAAMNTTRVPFQYYGAVSAVCKECIVTLFGSVKEAEYNEWELSFFRKYADSLKLAGRSGLSLPFESLMSLPDRFYEAYLAARSGRDQLTLFREAMPAPLFHGLCPRIDPDVFVHPALRAVQRYDDENGTLYCETLRAYSFFMHDKEKTSRALHIHRNTLLYRLNRMAELFGIAVEEPGTALWILNSFQLLDAAKNRADLRDLPGCAAEGISG